MKSFSTTTKLFFAALFVLGVFVSTKINFAPLMGTENQFFTIFQFFGPVAGGILGASIGPIIVLAAQAINMIINVANGATIELITVLRLAPMVFAAYYFGTKKKNVSIIIPILAIIVFLAHPVGREVWYFTLFWTIPIAATLFRHRLFTRSLGATFTAHSVGGALWIWTIPTTPGLWIALIPIVAFERFLFASGISISYIAVNTLLSRVESNVPLINVDKNYILRKSIWKYI